MPAQVIGQVARRHTAKAAQPLPETLVVRVHVLHMDDAGYTTAYPHPGTQVDRFVRNPMLASKAAVGRIGVADEKHLPVKPGQQVTLQLRYRQHATADHGIDGLAAAVARYQNTVELA